MKGMAMMAMMEKVMYPKHATQRGMPSLKKISFL